MTPTPQEPPSGESGDLPPEGVGDEIDTPLRGWIDPDDRLWRHPSEVAGARSESPDGALIVRSHLYRGRLMVAVGAVAAMAVVAWVVVLLSPASEHPGSVSVKDVSAESPVTTLVATEPTIPAIAETAGHSMVLLRAVTTHGTVFMTGVAVATGGLVATTADALSGWQSLSMVGKGGRVFGAQVVGIDPDSDVALVTVPENVPVAPSPTTPGWAGDPPTWH